MSYFTSSFYDPFFHVLVIEIDAFLVSENVDKYTPTKNGTTVTPL